MFALAPISPSVADTYDENVIKINELDTQTDTRQMTYLHDECSFVVAFPDGGGVAVLREPRSVVVLIEQIDPNDGVAVKGRGSFGLRHDDQPQMRCALKVEPFLVADADQSVVGVDFEGVLLVAAAKTVGDPLATPVRPHGRHLDDIFADGSVLAQLDVIGGVLKAESHLRRDVTRSGLAHPDADLNQSRGAERRRAFVRGQDLQVEEAARFHRQGIGGRHDTRARMNAEFRVGRLIDQAVDDLAARAFVLIFGHNLKELLVWLSESRDVGGERVFDENRLVIVDVSYGDVDLRLFRAGVVTSTVRGSDLESVAAPSLTIKVTVIIEK